MDHWVAYHLNIWLTAMSTPDVNGADTIESYSSRDDHNHTILDGRTKVELSGQKISARFYSQWSLLWLGF